MRKPHLIRTLLRSWQARAIAFLVLLLFSRSVLQAQLNVVYVDASNGSDSYTGANPTDVVAGLGPKATIHAGLSALANNGRLVIFAGQYAGDGVDTDGSPGNSTDNADIAITAVRYPRLISALTIELRALASKNEIRIINEANSVRSPSGALLTHDADQYIPNFVLDIPGGTLTVTSTNGTEYLSLAARRSNGLQPAGLFLEHGTLDIARSSSFRLTNGATISLRGSARFAREAPQKESDLNLIYWGDESFVAGAEAAYPSFGSGVLIVTKTAGSGVTFPAPMAFSGNNDAVQLRSGNAVFNGPVTLGNVGNQSSPERTADIIVESGGNVTFAAPLTLVVGVTTADSSISSIVNKGTGTVTFQKNVAWYSAGASRDLVFPESDSTTLVSNLGTGSVSFVAGILLSHTSATGNAPSSVEVAVVNRGTGKLSSAMPVEVVPRPVNGGAGLQQFSLAALNIGGGTLEISGTIRSKLVNAASGSLIGTVNITGATSIGSSGSSVGELSNAHNGIIYLGSNNLTLYGSVSHALSGSYITSTTGSVIIAAGGAVHIDGGTLPNLSIRQPSGGSTAITKSASLKSIAVDSGAILIQSSMNVSGQIQVSGGVLKWEGGSGLTLLGGSLRQRGGSVQIDGLEGGELKLQGDFTLSAGECRIGSSTAIAGSATVSGGALFLTGAPQSLIRLGTVSQTGGTITVDGSKGGQLTIERDFALSSGECRIVSSTIIAGSTTVSGGALTLGGLSQRPVQVGTIRQTGGTIALGDSAGGDLKVLGDFAVNSGECRLKSTISIDGSTEIGGGALVLEGAPDRYLQVKNFRQTGGIVTLGGSAGGDLRLLGDFTRTDGILDQGKGSVLTVAGTASQTLRAGPRLQLTSLTIGNASGVVSFTEPVQVLSNLSFGRGSKVELGSSTITLNGGAGVFTNEGSFNASGRGIVIGGATSASGGSSSVGSEIRAGADAGFSSFTIDVGAGNACLLKGSAPVRWTGNLSILSGDLDIASPIELAPASSLAELTIHVGRSNGITRSAGTFNSSKVHHTLRMTGELEKTYTVNPAIAADLIHVDTLIIDVTTDFGTTGVASPIEPRAYFQIPGALFVFGGSLRIGPSAAVRLQGDGKDGHSFELSGQNASHRIRGILTTADPGDAIVISGENAIVRGAEAPADVALIGNIIIRSSSLCRISTVRGFLGNFTTAAGSSVSLSMGGAPDERRIAGTLTLNGKVLALEGELEVQGGVDFNSGTLAFGHSNLVLTTRGNFTQAPGAGGYSTAGGSLIMNAPGSHLRIGTTEATGVPNLHILADTYLDSPGRVTKSLSLGDLDSNGIPTLFLGQAGNDLFFTGSTIYLASDGGGNKRAIIADGTTNGTPGGRLYIAGTSVALILNNDFEIEELVYNPPSTNGTMAILSTDLKPRTLTVSDILTHAGGQITLGFNHLALTGTGLKPGNRAYNRSDGTIGASTGELRFIGRGPQEFSCGFASSIPNLRIWNRSGVSKSRGSDPIIVTRTLDLTDGVFDFESGTVILENDATVVRRRSGATLGSSLSFRSSVNVSYLVDRDNGNILSGSEIPSAPSSLAQLTINNPNPEVDSSMVLMSRNVTVTKKIVLDGGGVDVGNSILTLAPGGTLEVNGGRIHASPASKGRFEVSAYNLVYSKSGLIGPASWEFQSGTGISVNRLTISGSDPLNPTTVRLYANRTINTLLMNAPRGGIEFGAPGSFVARNLSIRDSMTVFAGGFTNNTGANAVIDLMGTERQIVTVPDSGLSFQGGPSAIHLQLNNSAGFRLEGGDLKFGSGAMMLFVKGVLSTGERGVVLSRSASSQGFDRQGVGSTNVSHIAGRIRQAITRGAGSPDLEPNGRYEFPTGTATRYRPLILTFTGSYPANNSGTIDVAHVDMSPAGNAGLPLDGGAGVRVSAFAPYYWSVSTTPGSLSGGQKYDLETVVEAPGFPVPNAGDLRIIARAGGPPESSPWNLLGSGLRYDANSLSVTPGGDTVLSVRAQEADQALLGTSVVTLGMPIDRRPYLNFREPSSISQVRLDTPATFKVSVTDPDQKPLTISWSVNGVILKTGADTSFTHTFQSLSGTQYVRAVFRNSDGLADSTQWNFIVVGIEETISRIPTKFSLGQNFPNPFNPATMISYEVPSRSFVRIGIYDMLGRELAVLVDEVQAQGHYSVRWDASGFPTGTYLCRMSARSTDETTGRSFVYTRAMILAK